LSCSPEGRKFRSKTELEAHIKKQNLNVNVSDFCFTVRGQHLLDIAVSHDGNGQSCKRKWNLLQEAPVDGRLGNTVSSEVDGSQPKRKRMRLWERPSTKTVESPLTSDTSVADTSKMDPKKRDKHNNKSLLLNSCSKPAQQAGVTKSKGLLEKHASKSTHTKLRRSTKKLTVRMKFMPTFLRNLKSDSVESQSSSQSPISTGYCSPTDASDVLTSNYKASASDSKLFSQQHSTSGKKLQSNHRPQTSPTRSPTTNKKHAFVLPQNIVNGDESATDIQWIPPQSPFNLVEESLFHSSWKVLVASIILENGQGWLVSVFARSIEFIFSIL